MIGLLIAGSANTIAWFNSSNYLTIEYIDVSFKGGDDLLISTKRDDEESYKSVLDGEDLESSDLFKPVSSMSSQEWINNKASYPSFLGDYDRNASEIVEDGENKYVLPHVTVANEGYYSQELFLKSSQDHYAYVDTSNSLSYIVADEDNNFAAAEQLVRNNSDIGTIQELVEKMNYLQKSMRFSILCDSLDRYDYKVFDPFKENATYFGGTIDTEYKGVFDTKFDTESGKYFEIFYGDVSNRENLVYTFNQNNDKKTSPTWFDSGHKENTYIIDTEASINNGVVLAEEQSISLAENENLVNRLIDGDRTGADNLLLIPLKANVPTRIVVSIYMEGWDVDNVDSAMGGSFSANISFGLLDRYII